MYQALEQFNVLNVEFFFVKMPIYFLVIFTILFIVTGIGYFVSSRNLLFIKTSLVQIIFENLYTFVLDIIKQNIGHAGIRYFPIIFNTFLFVYLANITGLVGYNLQLTSHIMVTFSVSIGIFLGIIILGIYTLKAKFLNQFQPKDSPAVLFPLLVVIETTSYIIRPFTLGIRLFANMFSGHVLLFVIISFIIVIIEKKLIISKILILVLPILLMFFIMCLELLIMFLQAYVFIILLCVYLNDSLHAH